MRYASDNLNNEPTIEDAARNAGLSPRTLARRFREECGTTWREFLHDIRMFRAMELLADPSRSVTDTAHAVGFASLGAFTRAFVDYTGERPRDYHRRAQDDTV
jgi:AraC-like DNA-binding protein